MIIRRLRAQRAGRDSATRRHGNRDAAPRRAGTFPRWRDDTGSMPLALLVIFIGIALSTVLATSVLSQFVTTRTSMRQNHALAAAQAGIDVALTRIRSATQGVDAEGNPQGALANLPCGPLTGRVGDAGNSRYRVRITYLSTDPHGYDDAWADNPSNPSVIACGSSGPTDVPVFALVRADGSGVSTGDITTVAHRTLRATYTFKTTNKNIPGGLVHVNKSGSSLDLCLDAAATDPPAAGAEYPTAGTPVKMQRCTPGRASQTFAYDESLHLVLVTSLSQDVAGMCLDGGAAHTSGTVVTFQRCVPPTTLANQTRQQWSVNDASNFQGTKNGTNLDNGLCLRVQQANVPGSNVVLGSCSGAANVVNWSLDATVGAGMAGPATHRIVNFKQFGRCIDVTDFNENASFLIVWPCKQLPDGSVRWNQAWEWPAIAPTGISSYGSISTFSNDAGVNRWYCLYSPGVVGYGNYVRITPCTPSSPGTSARWTIYGDTTTDSDPTNNDKAYTIVDYRGYCLSPRDPEATPPDYYAVTLKISKLEVAVCNGTTLQKWNAPASFNQRSPLKDLGET